MSSAWSWRRRRKETHDSRRDSRGWVTTRLRFVFHAGRGGGGATAEGMGRAVAAASSLQRPRAREDSKLDGLAKITRTHPHSSQVIALYRVFFHSFILYTVMI